MTNILTWNDSLSTGFEEIDLQHKKLILIIEEVNSCLQKEGTDYIIAMSKAIKQLSDYTVYHFSEEENFMSKYTYPDLQQHKQKHSSFIDQVHLQIKNIGNSNPADSYQFYRFLGTWLLSHIAKEDQQWAAFIKAAKK